MKALIASTLLGLSAMAMSTSASAQQYVYLQPDDALVYYLISAPARP